MEHELYPGNKINLGICGWRNEKIISGDNTNEKTRQSFGAHIWPKKSSDAFKSGDEKERQPITTRIWGEKERQPATTLMWNEKERHPITTHMWDEKERQGLDNYCGSPSAVGEDKYCALSLESMVDFAISKLGTNINVISSSFAKNKDQYVVDEVKKIGDKAVMCHRLNFKNVVFYCHQVNATTTYMVPLVALDGTKAKALTVCHHDTRGVDPVVLYEILKVKPGTVPICHFVGNKAIAWVPDSDVNEHPCVI